MKWTIGAKLGAAFASVLGVLIVVGFVAHRNTVSLIEAADRVEHTHRAMGAVDETLLGLVEAEAGERAFAITTNPLYLQRFDEGQRMTREGLARFRELTRDNPAQQRRAAALGPELESRMTELARMIELRQKQGFEPAAAAHDDARNQAVILGIRRLLKEAHAEEARLLRERSTVEHERSERIDAVIGITVALSTVLTALAGLLLSLNIARPLGSVSEAAQRIALGDVEVSLPDDRREDEVGVLIQSFRRMSQSLSAMSTAARRIAEGDLSEAINPQSERDSVGKAFATMRDGLRRSTAELRDASVVLAASASEILAASTQVAASATETATAVSETTTTVEEVKQTAQLATQKARLVSETAQRASQTSLEGKRAVEDSIEGMLRIREQMGSIAETVVRLSEQSQAIGDIVASVTDLAEQSNLLAVNAAIEAARAGENGKGFSVVAQEVKSLADQSKHATAQVRSILADIQKAINTAVMATEQGSKTVEAGVLQSQEASEAIGALSTAIEAGAQAALQIAASSQQQSVGMDQVATAMENIKRASVQNVSGTKQTEVAAKNLHDVGLKLKELVERYRV